MERGAMFYSLSQERSSPVKALFLLDFLLAEVAVQQTLERLAVMGFVACAIQALGQCVLRLQRRLRPQKPYGLGCSCTVLQRIAD